MKRCATCDRPLADNEQERIVHLDIEICNIYLLRDIRDALRAIAEAVRK